MKKNYDSRACVSQHQDKWQKWRKDVLRHKQTLFLVVMDALVKINEDDLSATGSVAAIVVSLLSLSLAHVSSGLHRQAEDEDEVAQVQDD